MKQEDKSLLLKDICSRLPYGVKVTDVIDGRIVGFPYTLSLHINVDYANIMPYLRPMSSMTEEEETIFEQLIKDVYYKARPPTAQRLIDWLDKNMFDHRGLIKNGLALDILRL